MAAESSQLYLQELVLGLQGRRRVGSRVKANRRQTNEKTPPQALPALVDEYQRPASSRQRTRGGCQCSQLWPYKWPNGTTTLVPGTCINPTDAATCVRRWKLGGWGGIVVISIVIVQWSSHVRCAHSQVQHLSISAAATFYATQGRLVRV